MNNVLDPTTNADIIENLQSRLYFLVPFEVIVDYFNI